MEDNQLPDTPEENHVAETSAGQSPAIPQDRSAAISNPAIITSDIKNMEVHHHPDVEKKSFKEYLLEGLMIFLAVTMGFIAENIRENIVERQHEKGYMVWLVRDLHSDITKISERIKSTKEDIAMADSCFLLFGQGDYKNTSGRLYYLARRLSLRNFFQPSDGTTQQLNYAGGLSLIQNSQVVDSIQRYISMMTAFLTLIQLEDLEIAEYRKSMNGVFDGIIVDKMNGDETNSNLKRLNYNPPLVSVDKKDINNLTVQLAIVKGNRIKQTERMVKIQSSAESLINLIQKEYHLENE
jgi:hypothetical protein